MPIWKITDAGPVRVAETKLKQEKLLEEHLEDWIVANPDLLAERLLIIGRQVLIPDTKERLDLLALDPQGKAVIIELKRGGLKDPVDMQALRYASYIAKWKFTDFETQARAHLGGGADASFNFNERYESFCADAGVDQVPDLNSDQRLIVVGAEVKDKLGSVALWLLEHKVDIKVIQIDLYREGEALLIQPQVIVPLPVGPFRDVGRPTGGDPSRPWVEDGRAWHLDKRCSPQTREMLIRLDDLVRDNFEVDGPRWDQKFYVSYRVGNYNWLFIETTPSTLRLFFLVKAHTFQQDDIATRLGIVVFDKEDTLAEKLSLPCSVQIQNRTEVAERICIRLKDGVDLESPAFLALMKEAYKASPK